jgi:hypothetical protein
MAKLFFSLIVGVLFVTGLQGKTCQKGSTCSNDVGAQYRGPVPP